MVYTDLISGCLLEISLVRLWPHAMRRIVYNHPTKQVTSRYSHHKVDYSNTILLFLRSNKLASYQGKMKNLDLVWGIQKRYLIDPMLFEHCAMLYDRNFVF